MKRGVIIFLTLGFFFLVSAFPFTGRAVSGNVSLYVEGNDRISIYSPINKTYYFNVSDDLVLDLNVSASFDVEAWSYSLYDLGHSSYLEQEKVFSPNTSISLVRRTNVLTVYAKEVEGDWVFKELVFYVNVSNSAPILGEINDTIYVCEGTSLDYRFNATDEDEDLLYSDISPKNPFYTLTLGKSGYTTTLFKLFSGTLTKSRVGTRSETISVTDSYYSDSASLSITVIEINNPPVIENLGAQTVWTSGETSHFYKQVEVTDVEDGNSYDGNLEFNISFGDDDDLFSIDDYYGIMDYTPLPSQVGVYSIRVCVVDNALSSSDENISLCLPRSGNSEFACDDFTLTVTNENRAPQIINYTPENVLTVGGTDNTTFSAEVYDPDGTIPDIDWYVDGILIEHNEELEEDTFSYIFGCDVYGKHNVSVFTSDGLLNDSEVWNLTVNIVACFHEEDEPSGGGGGGGGGGYCIEVWACEDWGVCQSLENSFKIGGVSQFDYSSSREICNQKNLFGDYCGFQIRNCVDLSNCSNNPQIVNKPLEYQVCHYTKNPGCSDGIKNCHDGSCEVLVDCGGPCDACPTCSDGIQNQGEFGEDCGGPCPYECEKESPLKFNWLFLILILLLILLIIFIVRKFRNIKKYKSPFNREDLERV